MEWRIREASRGFYAELGEQHEGGEHIGGMNGATMPAFIVYESSRFDTKKEAEAYIRQRVKKENRHIRFTTEDKPA